MVIHCRFVDFKYWFTRVSWKLCCECSKGLPFCRPSKITAEDFQVFDFALFYNCCVQWFRAMSLILYWFGKGFQWLHLTNLQWFYKRVVNTNSWIHLLCKSISIEIDTHRFIENVDIPMLFEGYVRNHPRSWKNNLMKLKYVSNCLFYEHVHTHISNFIGSITMLSPRLPPQKKQIKKRERYSRQTVWSHLRAV